MPSIQEISYSRMPSSYLRRLILEVQEVSASPAGQVERVGRGLPGLRRRGHQGDGSTRRIANVVRSTRNRRATGPVTVSMP